MRPLLENCQENNRVNTLTALYRVLASNALVARTEEGSVLGAEALRIGPD
jgi:hypothetical protein